MSETALHRDLCAKPKQKITLEAARQILLDDRWIDELVHRYPKYALLQSAKSQRGGESSTRAFRERPHPIYD